MWLGLFICLVLAHLVADFVLQSNKVCKDKSDKKWKSVYHYVHVLIVFGLAWLVAWEVNFWWCALTIGATHFAIDMWKSYREENVTWFAVDQILHIAMMAGVAWMWCSMNDWSMPVDVALCYVAMTIAIIVCWKPSNIFIKLMLKHYSVNMPEEKAGGFNAGALIGDIERWLILAFVLMQHYDAIGLLIAAKSIIRFGDKETTKTEYVLAGTLMSIFIAVLAGVMVTMAK
jgi:hypothetical protein